MKAFMGVVGQEAFAATGSTNASRHGAVLTFRANVDHVLPWQRGGWTHLENLVSACWPCNYGKDRYTLDELGLDDPRLRAPVLSDGWDGLSCLRDRLLQVTV